MKYNVYAVHDNVIGWGVPHIAVNDEAEMRDFKNAMENDPKKEQKKKELEAELSNISKVEINGDSADVYFGDGKPITLKKVDGEWKVDVKKN